MIVVAGLWGEQRKIAFVRGVARRRMSSRSVKPSSATSVSRDLPASYGVTASTAARQIFRTGRIVRRSAAGAIDAPLRPNSAYSLTLIATHWYARRRHAARDLSSGPARR